jgi:hypothetical protein
VAVAAVHVFVRISDIDKMGAVQDLERSRLLIFCDLGRDQHVTERAVLGQDASVNAHVLAIMALDERGGPEEFVQRPQPARQAGEGGGPPG